ncbi:MAG: PKD domain-containing protein [Thermoleophilia bacterium]
MAIDSGDKAVLAWVGSDGKIRAAVRPAGAAWTTTTLPSTGTYPQVAVNPAGTAFVLFLGPTGAPLVSVRPAGGAWGTPLPLGAVGATKPQIATDGNGNAVAAWISATGELQTSTFDVTGPVLAGVSVPGAATAGQAVAMSAAPWDLWSPVASTAWDFGDGASATGPGTTHVYARPGTYVVTVNSADSLGNVSAAGRSITVTAPPVTPSRPAPGGPVGTVGGVTVGLPGASAATTPAPPLSAGAARKLPALRVGVAGTGSFRAGTRGILTVTLSRRVRSALVRVQIRRGVRYTTVTRGRVSGTRIPVALTFATRGRYLLRIQISEPHRATVNRLVRIAVRP